MRVLLLLLCLVPLLLLLDRVWEEVVVGAAVGSVVLDSSFLCNFFLISSSVLYQIGKAVEGFWLVTGASVLGGLKGLGGQI